MDRKINAARTYIFEYVVGVLWLIDLGVLTLDRPTAVDFARLVRDLGVAMGGATPPTFVTGFMLAVAGVVLPYCTGLAFNPVTYIVMNGVYAVQRKWKPAANRSHEDLGVCAVARVRQFVGVDAPVSLTFRLLMLLKYRQPRVVDHLIRTRDEVLFRAQAILPVSLLFGTTLWRNIDVNAIAFPVAASVGIIVFIAGAYDVNVALNHWILDLNNAVLVSVKGEQAVSKVSA